MAEKMRYWRMANPDHSAGAEAGNRLAKEAHPFVSKEAVSRYNQILLSCYEAQLAWRMGSLVREGPSPITERSPMLSSA